MKRDNINLTDFNNISLAGLNEVKLQNRQDTKYIFNQAFLSDLLKRLIPSYRLLEINENNIFSYENTYFDTDDFLFYNQHHNEKRKRFKVRFRKYRSTDDCFFEIKTKNNKNRTIKKRLKFYGSDLNLGESERKLVSDNIDLLPQQLGPKLNVKFLRITLADNKLNERLTIDTDLSVENGVSSKIFKQLVISEIKQKKYNPKSEFIQILRDMRIPEMRFSKYCMGMLHVNKNIKYNRFKPKLLQINKILTQD